MTHNSNQSADKALERARALQRKAQQVQSDIDRNAAANSNVAGQAATQASALWQALIKPLRVAWNWLGPVGRVIGGLFSGLVGAIRWASFAREGGEFVRGDEDKLVFSPKRLLGVFAAAVVLSIALHVALSALYYYSTTFEETVYITGKQEIETGELYQLGGCTSLPCSTASDNGKFYLIESSLYFPYLIYPEEDVFANIPQQNAACEVAGYGLYFRRLRWLYKSAQLYQHVTSVSCRPYTSDEITRALDDGKIQYKPQQDGS